MPGGFDRFTSRMSAGKNSSAPGRAVAAAAPGADRSPVSRPATMRVHLRTHARASERERERGGLVSISWITHTHTHTHAHKWESRRFGRKKPTGPSWAERFHSLWCSRRRHSSNTHSLHDAPQHVPGAPHAGHREQLAFRVGPGGLPILLPCLTAPTASNKFRWTHVRMCNGLSFLRLRGSVCVCVGVSKGTRSCECRNMNDVVRISNMKAKKINFRAGRAGCSSLPPRTKM